MAAALGLYRLLQRLGVGQLLSLLAMAAGFVVVGGILLFPETLLLKIVPTGRTLSEMASAASASLTAIGEQAAPVRRPGSSCSPAPAPGRWRPPPTGSPSRAPPALLALVPALGLFVFPAAIRPTSPAWYTTWFLLRAAGMLLFEGRARLATWGRWCRAPAAVPGPAGGCR